MPLTKALLTKLFGLFMTLISDKILLQMKMDMMESYLR